MRRRVVCALWGALLSGAVGCGPGADVRLGSERPLGDRDGGGDAGQDAGLAVWRCEAPLEDEVEIDYQLDLTSLCPRGPTQQLRPDQPPLPASDGSVWTLGTCSRRRPALSSRLLVHVDAAGTVARTLEIPLISWSPGGTVLALDEDGDPWLAISGREQGDVVRGSLQHYDSDLEPVGEPFVSEGWEIFQMENVPGHGFAFMGYSVDSNAPFEGDFKRFGLIDYAGRLLWTNEDDRWAGVPGLSVVSTGQIAVAATRQPYQDRIDPSGNCVDRNPMNILTYGSDGAIRWTRELAPQLFGCESDSVRLNSDAAGNLFAGKVGGAPNYDSSELFLQKLGAGGVFGWRSQIDVNASIRSHTVEPTTGRVFAVGVEGVTSTTFPDDGVLIEIAADGKSCRRHPYSGIWYMEHLVSSPTGELFFADGRSVGRFRPIEP